MVVHISELNNTELKQVLRSVPIKLIRQPILDDKKLEKKYIMGFRPASVTHIQLFPLYNSEIHSGNKEIIQTLKDAVRQFFVEKGIADEIEALSNSLEWMDCANFALALGKSNCEMPFELIKKICAIEIDDDKSAFIEKLAESIANETSKQNEESDTANNRFQEVSTECERLKKELESAQKKSQKIKKEKEDADKLLAEKKQALDECESQLGKTVTQLKECQASKEKSDRYISECETTISTMNKKIADLNDRVNTLSQEKRDISKTVEEIKNHNLLEYEELIKRLVADTIDDMQDDYDIDREQFETIIGELGDDCTILEIWDKISKINCEIMTDIEAAMRSKQIDISIIDHCNDVENNILAKYVVIKAIKSLYYEFASKSEKTRKLGDPKQA